MEYFGIDEKVLYPSSSFLSNDNSVVVSIMNENNIILLFKNKLEFFIKI